MTCANSKNLWQHNQEALQQSTLASAYVPASRAKEHLQTYTDSIETWQKMLDKSFKQQVRSLLLPGGSVGAARRFLPVPDGASLP